MPFVVLLSSVWRPHSLQDIRKIESLQRRSTKYITSYHLDYKSRLKATNLLPMSLWLEAQDVMLLIKLMSDPPSGFRLEEYITYMSSSTRASSLNKIKSSRLLTPRLNITRHFSLTELSESGIHFHTLIFSYHTHPSRGIFSVYSGSISFSRTP